MTPAEISALSDDELQRKLAEALGWTELEYYQCLLEQDKPGILGGRSPIGGAEVASGWHPIPDWPRDPAA